MRADIENKRQ